MHYERTSALNERSLGADVVVLDDEVTGGDVDALLRHRGHHEHLEVAAREALHHVALLVRRLTARRRALIGA